MVDEAYVQEDNSAGLDDVDNFYDYDASKDHIFYARKFYGDAAEPDIDDNFYDHDDSNDKEFDGVMVSAKNLKLSMITVIIQANTGWLNIISEM